MRGMQKKAIAVLLLLCIFFTFNAGAVTPAQTDELPPYSTTEIIVKYKMATGNASGAQKKQAKKQIWKTKKQEIATRTDLVQVESIDQMEKALADLQADPNVEYAVPNSKITPAEVPEVGGWGLANTGESVFGTSAVAGVDLNITPPLTLADGEGIVIAVIDTGIDMSHPDLQGNSYQNEAEVANGQDDDGNGYIDDTAGWDFVNQNASVFDTGDDSHGTAVAGLIAAVAPGAEILPLKVMEDGEGRVSDVIEAIEYAKAMGAEVVNCSFGTEEYNFALKEAMRTSGLFFVCAAGNGGPESLRYPAGFGLSNVLSVGAVDCAGAPAAFSGTGELYAPGQHIFTTGLSGTYTYASGTSVSAAFVTGVAALLCEAVPEIAPFEMKSALKNGATPRGNAALSLVDAYAAIQCALPLNFLQTEGRLSDALEAAELLITAPVAEILTKFDTFSDLNTQDLAVLTEFFSVSSADLQTCAGAGLNLADSIVAIYSSARAELPLAETLDLLASFSDAEAFDAAIAHLADLKKLLDLSETEEADILSLAKSGLALPDIASALIFSRVSELPIASVFASENESFPEGVNGWDIPTRWMANSLLRTYHIKADALLSYLQSEEGTVLSVWESLLNWQRDQKFYVVDGRVSPYWAGIPEVPYFNKYKASTGYAWQVGNAVIDQTDGMLQYNIPLVNLSGRGGLGLNLGLRFDPEVADIGRSIFDAEQMDCEYVVTIYADFYQVNSSNGDVDTTPYRTESYNVEFEDRDLAYAQASAYIHDDDYYEEGWETIDGQTVSYQRRYRAEAKAVETSGSNTHYYKQPHELPNYYDERYHLGIGWAFDLPSIENTKLDPDLLEDWQTIEGKDIYYLHLPGGAKYRIDGNELEGYFTDDLSFVTGTSVTIGGKTSTRTLFDAKTDISYFFDADGNYLGAQDKNGNQLQVHYNTDGSIQKTVDTAGRELRLQYTTSGTTRTITLLLASAASDTSPETLFTMTQTYVSNYGKYYLTSLTDAAGRTTQFSYQVQTLGIDLYSASSVTNWSFDQLNLIGVTAPTGAYTQFDYETLHRKYGEVGRCDYPAIQKIHQRSSVSSTTEYNTVSFDMFNYPYERVPDNLFFPLHSVVNKQAKHTMEDTYVLYTYTDNLVPSSIKTYDLEDDTLLQSEQVLSWNDDNLPTETQSCTYVDGGPGYTLSGTYMTWDSYGNLLTSKTRSGSYDGTETTLNPYLDSRTEAVYGETTKAIPTETSVYSYAEDDNEYGTKTFNTLDTLGRLTKTESYTYNFTTNTAVKKLSQEEYTYDSFGNVTKLIQSYSPDGAALTDQNCTAVETRYTYDSAYQIYPASVRILGVKDPDGNAIGTASADGAYIEQTYEYNKRGLVTQAEQSGGLSSSNTYNSLGELTSKTYWSGNTMTGSQSYAYDYQNRTETVTNLDGTGTYNVYDVFGNLTDAYTFGTGGASTKMHRQHNTYDTEMRLVSHKDFQTDDGTKFTLTTNTYDIQGRLTESTTVDQSGNEVAAKATYEYGQTVAGEERYDTVTTNLFADSSTIPAHKTVQYYDGAGRLNNTEYFLTGSVNLHTQSTYTDYNHLSETSGDFSRTETYTVDPSANTATVNLGTNNYQPIDYESGYDGAGQMIWQKDANGNTTKFTYDILGRLIKQENPVGANAWSTTKYYYDIAGNLVKQAQQCNAPGEAEAYLITEYGYDGLSRLLWEKVGGRYTQYDYGAYASNGSSNPYRVFSGLSDLLDLAEDNLQNYPHVIFTYDSDWNVLSYTHSADLPTDSSETALSETYEYDDLGRLTEAHTRDGRTLTYTYDAMGRTTKVQSGTAARNFTYNKLGQLISASVTSGTQTESHSTYLYDALGRLTEENTYNDLEHSRFRGVYSYTAGNLTQYDIYRYTDSTLTDDSSVAHVSLTQYTYNVNHQLTGTGHAGGGGMSYSYDANGNLISHAFDTGPSVITTLRTYNAANQVASITTYGNRLGVQATRYQETYTYDNAGRLSKKELATTDDPGYDATTNPLYTREHTVYTYDNASRLIDVVHSELQYSVSFPSSPPTIGNQTGMSYEYDDRGNLDYVSHHFFEYVEYSYHINDAQNRLVEQHTYNNQELRSVDTYYTYDDAGNRLTETATTTLADNTTSSNSTAYTYTPFGQTASVAKTEGGSTTTTSFQYDAFGKRIAKTTGDKVTQSVWSGDDIFYEYVTEGSTTKEYRYFHGPAGYEGGIIDSVVYVAQVNYKGDVIGTMDYYSTEFDKHSYSDFGSTEDNEFIMPYGFSGEYTDVETGHQYLRNRYYDPATSRFTQEDNNFIDGFNLYAYCVNDPINRVDPSGRCYGYCSKTVSRLYKVFDPNSDEMTYFKGYFSEDRFTVHETAGGEYYRVESKYCLLAESHRRLAEQGYSREEYHAYNCVSPFGFGCDDPSHLYEAPEASVDVSIPEAPDMGFDTPDAAAKDFAIRYNGVSIRSGCEFNTNIYAVVQDGRFVYKYDTPVTDWRIDSTTSIIDKSVYPGTVASIHTHGGYVTPQRYKNDIYYFDNEKYSPDDLIDASSLLYTYLVTPSGHLKSYNVKTGVRDFGSIAPHDPRTRNGFLFWKHSCDRCAK